MYAYIRQTERGFIEEVCTLSNASSHPRDPPPPWHSRMVLRQHTTLDDSHHSEYVFTAPIFCTGNELRLENRPFSASLGSGLCRRL
jgi:hypothetical protein